jgi:hypothetical protein
MAPGRLSAAATISYACAARQLLRGERDEAASPDSPNRSQPEDPLSGEHPGRIGPYRILSILGEGVDSQVHEADIVQAGNAGARRPSARLMLPETPVARVA